MPFSLSVVVLRCCFTPVFLRGVFKERATWQSRVLNDSVRNSGGNWTGLRISVMWFKKEIVCIRLRRV